MPNVITRVLIQGEQGRHTGEGMMEAQWKVRERFAGAIFLALMTENEPLIQESKLPLKKGISRHRFFS